MLEIRQRSKEAEIMKSNIKDYEITNIVNEILADFSGDSLNVDPFLIAKNEGIFISQYDFTDDFDALIEYQDDGSFIIFLNNKVELEERRRFTIAHELGHYFIPHHQNKLVANEWMISCQTAFSSDNILEKEADKFAAELLMPTSSFYDRVSKDLSLKIIEALSKQYKTSITSTAIRAVGLTELACSIVVSKNNIVAFSTHSEKLRSIGIYGINKNDSIPSNSKTYLESNSKGTSKFVNGYHPSIWYKSPKASNSTGVIWEEVMHLGDYGLLTLLIYES